MFEMPHDVHQEALYKPVYQGGLALLSAFQKVWQQRLCLKYNKVLNQGCVVRKDSNNVPEVILKVPEVKENKYLIILQ